MRSASYLEPDHIRPVSGWGATSVFGQGRNMICEESVAKGPEKTETLLRRFLQRSERGADHLDWIVGHRQ